MSALTFILFYRVPVAISTKQVYSLSTEDLNVLKERAVTQSDATAAMRVAQYYERYQKNTAAYIVWLRRASNLGDKAAQKRMQEFGSEGASLDVNVDPPGKK